MVNKTSMTRPPPSPRKLPICAKLCVTFFFFVVIISIVGSIVMPMVFNAMVSNIIDEMMVITPSSDLFQGWKDPPMPIYQSFYFFDVLNKEDIMKGEKPEVMEVGPYTYMVNISRHNISFSGENDTVTFSQIMSYSFIPDMSVGPEDDLITTVNLPLMTAASSVKYLSFWERLSVSAIASIHDQEAFKTLTVQELLWGYRSPILGSLQKLAGKELIKTDMFGLLYGQNGSNPNEFTINTGESNSSLLSQISVWNGQTSLSWWGDEQANMINGTDGSMFHPGVSREDTLYMFSPFNFRSLPFVYDYDTSFRGLPLYHYYVPRFAFANPEEYPPNAGFCLEEDTKSCTPTGLLNISSANQGVPMSLSHPHFLYGDEKLINAIDGLEPNETLHQNCMDIEPLMGVPFIVTQRNQINFYVQEVQGISQTYGIQPNHFPIFWIETHGTIPDSIINEYKHGMKLTKGIGNGSRYGCIGVGIISLLMAISLIIYYRARSHRIQDNQNKPKSVENDFEYVSIPAKENGIQQNGAVKQNGTVTQNGAVMV